MRCLAKIVKIATVKEIKIHSSKLLKNLLMVSLPILLIAISLPAREIEILEGRSLLEAFRNMQGRTAQDSYENRSQIDKELQEEPEKAVPAVENQVEEKAEVKTTEALEVPATIITETIVLAAEEKAPTTETAITPAPIIRGDKLLSMIPPESMLAIRINGFQNSISQLDQYLTGVLPMPLAASLLIRTNLAGLLGSPDLKGIDMYGSFAVFMREPNTASAAEAMPAEPLSFVLVPISNYSLFVSGNLNVSEPDAQGISNIISQGAPPLAVKQAGDFALITLGTNKDILIETAKTITEAGRAGIAANLETGQIEAAITDALWVFLNTQVMPQGLDDAISAWAMAAAQMSGGAIPSAEALDIGPLLKQLRFISISANPKPDVFNIKINAGALENSEIEKTLAADSAGMTAFIQQLGAKRPADAGEEMAVISALIPGAEQADFVGSIDLLGAAAKAASMTGQAGEQMPQGKSRLSFAIKADNGRLSADIALPKEHLAELVMTAMTHISQQAEQPDF